MEHRHFCSVGIGHFFTCHGSAMRPFDSQPTVCICPDCGYPMSEGDHGKCAEEVESFPCPAHLPEHMIACGYNPGDLPDPSSPISVLSLFSDEEGYEIQAWCRWCMSSFRFTDEFRAHRDDLVNSCSAFAELRNNGKAIRLLEWIEEAIEDGIDDIEF